MITIGQLAQHLLTIGPQHNPGRLVFYHYLKNFLPLEEALQSHHLDDFYDRALVQLHWQTHKKELGEVIYDDLKAIGARRNLGIDINRVLHCHQMQVVNLENSRDFAILLAQEVDRLTANGEKVRNFRYQQDKSYGIENVLFVRLLKDFSVIVEVYQNTAAVINGRLKLLKPHTHLEYNPSLDFKPNILQILSAANLRAAVFQSKVAGRKQVVGRMIQGTSFHCTETFDKNIDALPELLQMLRNVEEYFINPASDHNPRSRTPAKEATYEIEI